ncbi:hypothetical protein [Segetibacter sp.]|uniref:hypothetical protein n=1 Tax=Segetibacter sp. TaxID=2231182 RepID=UPI0026239133|nr:hypothetical protein [Segetibacter sp.]
MANSIKHFSYYVIETNKGGNDAALIRFNLFNTQFFLCINIFQKAAMPAQIFYSAQVSDTTMLIKE